MPAWFKNADSLLGSPSIPHGLRVAIILPFLNARVRAYVADQSDEEVLAYEGLKTGGTQTPETHEYKGLFQVAQKSAGVPWS